MALFSKKATLPAQTGAKAEPKKSAVKTEKVQKPKKVEKTEKLEKEVVAAEVVKTEEVKRGKGLELTQILVRPHVTEKATDLSERGVYAFEINKRAGKNEVMRAIEAEFKVRPVKIAIVNKPAKYAKNPRTNRRVVKKPGMKKAFVYLKSGDKIEFV